MRITGEGKGSNSVQTGMQESGADNPWREALVRTRTEREFSWKRGNWIVDSREYGFPLFNSFRFNPRSFIRCRIAWNVVKRDGSFRDVFFDDRRCLNLEVFLLEIHAYFIFAGGFEIRRGGG